MTRFNLALPIERQREEKEKSPLLSDVETTMEEGIEDVDTETNGQMWSESSGTAYPSALHLKGRDVASSSQPSTDNSAPPSPGVNDIYNLPLLKDTSSVRFSNYPPTKSEGNDTRSIYKIPPRSKPRQIKKYLKKYEKDLEAATQEFEENMEYEETYRVRIFSGIMILVFIIFIVMRPYIRFY